mmetsp:Transcript_5545/g.8420  ORF Transcript_5545/g.8420 Transcript_5545/m.8420 type:complete len:84 (-) Transcript_5545:372-623(-)
MNQTIVDQHGVKLTTRSHQSGAEEQNARELLFALRQHRSNVSTTAYIAVAVTLALAYARTTQFTSDESLTEKRKSTTSSKYST